MKDFFKYTLATITGIAIASFIGIIILFSLFGAIIASASSEKETKINAESIFVLNLTGELTEKKSSTPLLPIFYKGSSSIALDDVLSSIKKAKTHEKIKGIHLNMGPLNAGIASIEAIREALIDFQSSGKPVTAYGELYTQGMYYLASVADKIYINPQGTLDWRGMAAQPIFYTNLMNNIGIEMQVFKVGTYKSAVEPYTQEKMSQASKEQVSVFLNDIWSHTTSKVSESRSIPTNRLNMLADEVLTFKQAPYYIEQGLVDSLVYKNDVQELIKKEFNEADPSKINTLSLKQMTNLKFKISKDAKTIAIYYASGEITDIKTSYGQDVIYTSKVISDLKKLEKNEKIKGVVIRVNSPGGSAYGSEQIWHAIKELKAKKPVAISMGDYAASGGYYISSAADYIVAEPTTLTGSIGIFAMIPSAEKLLNTVGVNFDVVKTNAHSDFGGMGRKLTDSEASMLQSYVENGYELFIKRCADGRNMTSDEIKKIAEGRVWTGTRALELGLVDELGGIDRAIDKVVKEAGLETIRIRKYPAPEDVITELLNASLADAVQLAIYSKDVLKLINQTKFLEQLSQANILQARIPYTLQIQ